MWLLGLSPKVGTKKFRTKNLKSIIWIKIFLFLEKLKTKKT